MRRGLLPRPSSFRFLDLPRAHDGALSAGLKARDQVTRVMQAALECRAREHVQISMHVPADVNATI
jgi:hypothetical protein